MNNLRSTIAAALFCFAFSAFAQDNAQEVESTEAFAPIDDPFAPFDEDAAKAAKTKGTQADVNKPTARSTADRVELQDNYETALKLAQLEQRPLLLILGADWCSWCRKLEGEFESKDADAILKKWIVVKVDVDVLPNLAQEMQANALPGLRVLGTDQEIVASKEGYMPLVELQAWLDSSLATADPTIQRVLFDSEAVKESDLAKLIEFLGNKSPNLRIAAQRRLTGSRNVAAPALVDTLRNGRLSQQLCALNILQAWQAPVAEIDPWQPETIDAESVQPLIEWLRNQPANETEKPQAEIEALPVDEQAASAWIEKLLTDESGTHTNLMAEATLLGKGWLPVVRMRIANGSELDDSQRTTLRELLYRLLVGDKCRLEHSSLLVALASLRAETHRAAAVKLLSLATSQDQPLVDELSVDADPLVRELTVAKLQNLGAFRDSEQVRKLLADKSPSVRTAVLRELSEHPQDQATATLIAYIDRETDEDLLVYATKTLGQLGAASGAEDALCRLAKNDRWRVRAAALDAVEQSLQKNSRVFGYDDDRNAVSAPIAEAVLKASVDDDAFVSEKAMALLPKILSKKSSEVVGEFLLEHPERIRLIDKDVSEYEREKKFAPLLGHAEKWLKSDDQKKVRGATQLIAKLKPVLLRERIPGLLESKDPAIRIAAMSASVASLVQMRDEQLEAALNLWRSRMETVEVGEPWAEIPLALKELPPPKNAKPADVGSQSALKTSASDSSQSKPTEDLAVVDDFFGSSSAPALEPEVQTTEEPTEPILKLDVSDPFGAVDDLFGSAGAPSETVAKLLKLPAEIQGSQVEPTSNLKGFKKTPLASVWLAEWQSGKERKEVEWVQTLQTSLESLLNGNGISSSEALWAQVGLLVSGKSEFSETIAMQISSLDKADGDESPHAESVLPWMPTELRLTELKRSNIDWHDLKNSKLNALLESATVIDNLEIADFIYQQTSDAKLKEEDLQLVRKILLRALIGARADEVSNWVEGDTAKVFSKPLKRRVELLPGSGRAVEWLAERYRSTQDVWSKALLLLTASHLDHSLAARSAVGIVANATVYSLETRVALSIALADTSELSSDRAVQWLEHPLTEVRLRSAKRLLMTGNDYSREAMELGAAIVSNRSDELIGLWEIRRELPVEALRELSRLSEPESWYAKLLLMSTGVEYSLPDLLKDHGSKEDMLPIVCALAKAERTDEEAIAFYTKASETLTSYGEPAQLLTLVRGLKGKEITELRRKLRAKDSSTGTPSF